MPIALLSDFGLKDAYVGAMKGVLATLASETAVIDLSHEIAPFDIIEGGLQLYQAYPYFPPRTVFVAVVDPGVGGARRAILAQTEAYFFVGPDNGLMSMALAEQKLVRLVELRNEDYFLKPTSATFHGRDIFAPVAAHLSRGVAPEAFGPAVKSYERHPAFFPSAGSDFLEGQILAFDRFGSAVSNWSRDFLKGQGVDESLRVEVAGSVLSDLRNHYEQAPETQPFLLFGSRGLLEISVQRGSAQATLGLKRGMPLRLLRKRSNPG